MGDVGDGEIVALLARFGLTLVLQAEQEPIRGSYWGEPEAGIVGKTVFARADTPVHSLLHEACHVICMDGERRRRLDRDAAGDDLEEAGVCYLQVLLADELRGVGQYRLMMDMDAWGYSFRMGSTRAWFQDDAEDARKFLLIHGLINSVGKPAWRLRD